MPVINEVTNLLDAFRAQAAFVSAYTDRLSFEGYTDDDTDYLPGALALLAGLQSDHYASLSHADTTAAIQAIAEYDAYPGDYGPPQVFAFLGLS